MPDAGPPPYAGKKATAFPLIPFGGRLRDAAVQTETGMVRVPEHPPESGLVLHGDGARRPWGLKYRSPNAATLSLDWPSTDWPFEGHCEMTFAAFDDRFEVSQSVGTTEGPAPFALGWHPYFRADGDSLLLLDADAVSMNDPEGFARPFTRRSEALKMRLRDVASTRSYRLSGPDVRLVKQLAGIQLSLGLFGAFDEVTIHVPPQAQSIAIEPVSHVLTSPCFPNVGTNSSLHGNVAIRAHQIELR